jgi:hypothetical protein
MADAFAPQLGSEVRFNQPVENTSTATAISGLGSILGAFIEPRKEEAKGPMGSANNPDVALANYTKELSDIMQTAQDVSPNALAVNIRKLNVRYAGEGFDVTGPAFKSARESITGRQEETLIFTQEELVFNDLIKTPEGQSKLALAERELMAQSGGDKPSGTDTINYILAQEAEKQSFDRLKVENEMSYLAAAPQFQMQVSNMGKQFLASLDIIEENGLRTDDPEMLQNSYLSYQAERNRIISKIPLGLPNREQEIKGLFQVTDEFFSSMGIDSGKFERLPKSQLDLKRKAIVAVEMLNNKGDAASAMLATGILNADYKMSDDTMLLVQSVLGENALVNTTPEWITDAGIVVSNDMVTVAQQLSTIGSQAIKTVADHEAALTDLVGADVAEKWGSLTSEQAWKDLQATTGLYKGFSRDAILNGQVSTDIPYQMAFKLAMGLKTIDFENEAVSFGGLRKSVDASLPGTLAALEAKDPEKGKAARTLLYVATGKAARQYEAQIAAEEQRFGMSFNPKVRGYSLDYSTIADAGQRQIINRVVEEQYGGDIIKAVEDKFAKAGNVYTGRSQAALTGAMISALPSVDDMKRLLDLRNSAVYLDSLSRSIEPEDFRVAREMGRDAFSTTEAQAIGMGAIEAIANAPLPGEITTETIPAGGAGGGSSSTPTNIGDALGLDFSTLEAENGLPQGFLERTAFIESKGNPNAKNPNSSAGGLFQQTDGNAKDYGVKDRFDPVQSTDGAVDFAVDNMRILTVALGREPTGAELYLAHQQGGSGARALLSNGNANVVDVLTPVYKGNRERAAESVRLNGGNTDMTASEFASLWLDKFNNTKTIAPTAGRPSDANAVASRAGEAVQRAVNPSAGPASVDVNLSSGGAPVAPMDAATAALPEAIPAESAMGAQGASGLSPAIAIDPDVQAFIQEIAGDPDKSYTSEAEFLAAQERGELEPGDTVVVDGDVYVIRKNGTARRLGSVNA